MNETGRFPDVPLFDDPCSPNPLQGGELLRSLFQKKNKLMSRTQLAALERELLQQKTRLAEKELALNYKMDAGRIHLLDTEKIFPNPSQPRKQFQDASIVSLADSIQRVGILQPLSVRPVDCSPDKYYDQQTKFLLIAGERRLRAAKLLRMDRVPCIIVNADSKRSAELALIENLQRENLNIFEQAGAIASLIDIYHLTQEQIARQLSVSQSFVANKLRILRLSLPERDFILETGLTERHARAFLRIPDADQRREVLANVARKKMNVAQTEEYIDRLLCAPKSSASSQHHRVIIKDVRLFFNSVEKAVSTVKSAGVAIRSEREETEEEIRWLICIPKRS